MHPKQDTAEEFKVTLRNARGEVFVARDGQAYGGGEHVCMARPLGSGVSMLVREGYVRAVVGKHELGMELDVRNPTAVANAVALLRENPTAEFVVVDTMITGDVLADPAEAVRTPPRSYSHPFDAPGAAGIAVGIVISRIISHVAEWPTLLSPVAIIGGFWFSAALGISFGYYPARKAAHLDPIEPLRYE